MATQRLPFRRPQQVRQAAPEKIYQHDMSIYTAKTFPPSELARMFEYFCVKDQEMQKLVGAKACVELQRKLFSPYFSAVKADKDDPPLISLVETRGGAWVPDPVTVSWYGSGVKIYDLWNAIAFILCMGNHLHAKDSDMPQSQPVAFTKLAINTSIMLNKVALHGGIKPPVVMNTVWIDSDRVILTIPETPAASTSATPTTDNEAVAASGSTMSIQEDTHYVTIRTEKREAIATGLARWGIANAVQVVQEQLGDVHRIKAFGRCAETLPYLCLVLAADIPANGELVTIHGVSLKPQAFGVPRIRNIITKEKSDIDIIRDLLPDVLIAACNTCCLLMELPPFRYLELKSITLESVFSSVDVISPPRRSR